MLVLDTWTHYNFSHQKHLFSQEHQDELKQNNRKVLLFHLSFKNFEITKLILNNVKMLSWRAVCTKHKAGT